jgi:hypothetical protein
MTRCSVAFRPNEVGDRRTRTIGPDHEFSRNLRVVSLRIPEMRAAHAALGGSHEVDQPGSIRDLGTGFAGGVHEQPVDDGAPRRVQTIHAVLRLDLDVNDVISVME